MKMMQYICQALCCLLPVAIINAQNLVPNGSFEEYASCPGNFYEQAGEFRIPGWLPATQGTPDHFHSCSKGAAGVPHNWAGISYAHDGDGFAGIYGWMDNDADYREYLQARLKEPLIADTTYLIEFHYKLSSYSRYAIDRMGLLLTDSAASGRHNKVINEIPTLSVIQDSALTLSTGLWEHAKMEYKAAGGEQYVIIGNFFSNAATRYYRIQFTPDQQEMLRNSAYYYIDGVKILSKYLVEKELMPAFTPEIVDLNTPYVLKNINFAFDSYKLHPSSFEELDKVILWMQQQPDVRLTLSGHTDDRGGDHYNYTLSLNRAKTVAEYLRLRGVEEARLITIGYGKRVPLINSTSEDAREKNRRVEVCFENNSY